ncbi:hypothetical protein SDC9_48937 [bioreactor metagenome]|uniref:Uncharacterized protein n=1 Tax=bioreactor metagenome TaxID=1076179 RepID=A0A644WFY7_9ZZZZ
MEEHCPGRPDQHQQLSLPPVPHGRDDEHHAPALRAGCPGSETGRHSGEAPGGGAFLGRLQRNGRRNRQGNCGHRAEPRRHLHEVRHLPGAGTGRGHRFPHAHPRSPEAPRGDSGADPPGAERHQALPGLGHVRRKPHPLYERQRHHPRRRKADRRHAETGRHLQDLRRDESGGTGDEVLRHLLEHVGAGALQTRSEHRSRRPHSSLHLLSEPGRGRSGHRHGQNDGASLHLRQRRGESRKHRLRQRAGLRRHIPCHRLRPGRELRRCQETHEHRGLRRALH